MTDTPGIEAEALGPVGAIVLNLAPEMGRWLFGPDAGPVVAAVQRATTLATGGSEVGYQVEALADPAKAAALRLALARIAAAQANDAADRARTALLTGVAAATGGRGGGAPDGGGRYGAPLISMVVLLTFAGVMVVALTRSMPQGAEPVLNVLLGTLGAMATSVVGYWVGSSAGSARKEERLASLAERS